MTNYHLPPEELKQAAEKDSPSKRDQQCFLLGSNHTMQTISPTLDKALEALTESHCEILDVRSIYKITSGNYERLTVKLAKISEAINDIKKLKG